MKILKQLAYVCSSILLFFIVTNFNSCSFYSSEEHSNTPGIVLSFDDYHLTAWEKHFDLFDEYEAKVTFFVDERKRNVFAFCNSAQERGHEIGYHTKNHLHLREVSRKKFFEETVSRIDAFKDAGIELKSFAYPYGEYDSWMHKELLKYYKIVRGFDKFKRYTMDEIKSGFIYSESIDNIRYKSDVYFYDKVNNMLQSAREYGKIVALTSHSISGNDWGITPKRLEWVLKKCQEYGLTFYRYNDLQ
jgi:peptidoglycan/xylan/chitin deacetylase (PgdA/CDA1 family)